MSKLIDLAKSRGSAAKTRAGARKYLLANLPVAHRGLLAIEGRARPQCSRQFDHDTWREQRMQRRADGRALSLGYSTDISEQYRMLDDAWQMHRDYLADCSRTITRDSYGAIIIANGAASMHVRPEVAAHRAASQLVREAVGLIPAACDSISWERRGSKSWLAGIATHHEIYGYAPGAVVVSVRHTEANKYGVRTINKTYFLITRADDGEILAKKTYAPIAKHAKLAGNDYARAVRVAQGERIPLVKPARRGYKLVARTDTGYASVWDNSQWQLGVTRSERISADHSSGLYYYESLDDCLSAARTNGVFQQHMQHSKLAILEVEASGNEHEYANGKICAGRITPIADIGSTI
jgi:hypothetical protein